MLSFFKKPIEYEGRRTTKEIKKRIKITKTHNDIIEVSCPFCNSRSNDPVRIGVHILTWCLENTPEKIKEMLGKEREKVNELESKGYRGGCWICKMNEFEFRKLAVGLMEWAIKERD